MDGFKTGYTRRAGYCLVATAERHEMRLISVILGAPFRPRPQPGDHPPAKLGLQ